MEKINPFIVPQRRLYDGSSMPAIGMGTFGSDRFTAEQVSGDRGPRIAEQVLG